MDISWPQIQEEAVSHLVQLLQFDTTNPPGNEWPLLLYLAECFKTEGFEPILMETAPHRGNLVVRLKGSGQKRPLLLTSHVDVVPADPSLWKHPPFSGHVDETGMIWGRGAVDMKQMTIMNMMVIFLTKRQGALLDRDLVFVAVSDEEAGCEWGSEWLVKNRSELISDCEFGFNEVGGFSLYLNDRCYYPIQVAEKGYCWLRIRSNGRPGHGSMPHQDNALVKLAKAVESLGRERLPYHKTPVVDQFIRTIAESQPFPVSFVLGSLLHPTTGPFVLDVMIRDEDKANGFAAMLHNTVSPTILRGGNKINVIPPWAEVEVDGRTLPGQSDEDLIREIQEVIGPRYEIQIIRSDTPLVLQANAELLKTLGEVLQEHDPGCIPVPYMTPGFTDAKNYARLGIQCYGFCPMKLDKDLPFNQLFHGNNERISKDALLFGIKVLFAVIQRV